jgi:hypothetical protein
MDLDTISAKHLNELEHSLRELLLVMRKAHLQNEPLAKSLHEFEFELGQIRRRRFDAANPEYTGY